MRKYNKDFIWNMIGSVSNAVTTLLVLVIVTRINGIDDGGIISIAFAGAQLMFTIGAFEVRTYQVTDINKKFDFTDYYTFRIITCTVMIVVSLIYIFESGYSWEKGIVIFLMCIYYMIDAFADVFEGLFQSLDNLDMSGKSLGIRVIFSTIIFAIVLVFTKDLVIASVANCISAALWVLFYDIILGSRVTKIKLKISFYNVNKLFFDCVPLFVVSFLFIYLINTPKYSIDRYMSLSSQNYYNMISMPSFVINLFSLFLMRPMITKIAVSYHNNNLKSFVKRVTILLAFDILITIVAVIVAFFIGIPVLSFIYGTDLATFKTELIVLVVAGGASALGIVMYNVLTALRKQKIILIIYSIVAVFATMITSFLVKKEGIFGATIAYFAIMTSLFVLLSVFFVIIINKSNKKINKLVYKQ